MLIFCFSCASKNIAHLFLFAFSNLEVTVKLKLNEYVMKRWSSVLTQDLLLTCVCQSCLSPFKFLVQKAISVMFLHGSSVVVLLPGLPCCD